MVNRVEQGLGGMFACAVAGVEDRHAGVVGGQLGRARLRVAQDDDVGILLQGAHRVGQGLALADGAELHALGDRDDRAAQPLHGGNEGGAGARAWFVEQAGQDVPFQQVNAADALTISRISRARAKM